MQRVKISTSIKPIQVVRAPKVADEVKIAEIELAVTMACHSAILTVDHLGEVIARNAERVKRYSWKKQKGEIQGLKDRLASYHKIVLEYEKTKLQSQPPPESRVLRDALKCVPQQGP